MLYLQRLPILIYESLLELVQAQPKILYTHVHYTLATEEAERVGVDHIARSSVSGSAQTSAGQYKFWEGGREGWVCQYGGMAGGCPSGDIIMSASLWLCVQSLNS